jgi:hypothetical protein
MNIELTTPAILFPAISLLSLAYTNRFLALARIVRELKAKHEHQPELNLLRQIDNLTLRINLIKAMQAAGIAAMLLCVVSIIAMFFNNKSIGEICFGSSLLLMTVSLLISLWEIMLSGNALKIELENLRQKHESVE